LPIKPFVAYPEATMNNFWESLWKITCRDYWVEFGRHPEGSATKKFSQGFPLFYFDLEEILCRALLHSISYHLACCTSQSFTLHPAYPWQKEKRAVPGKIYSCKFFPHPVIKVLSVTTTHHHLLPLFRILFLGRSQNGQSYLQGYAVVCRQNLTLCQLVSVYILDVDIRYENKGDRHRT